MYLLNLLRCKSGEIRSRDTGFTAVNHFSRPNPASSQVYLVALCSEARSQRQNLQNKFCHAGRAHCSTQVASLLTTLAWKSRTQSPGFDRAWPFLLSCPQLIGGI